MIRRPTARDRALRALAEGAVPTLDLLADASARSARMLKYQAQREGWALERAPQEDVAQRIRITAALLLNKVEALGRAAMEEGGKINKAEIDGLIAMIRGLDKIGEIMRPEEAAKENQIRHDEELAAVLDRINDRILELAREFAAEMGADQCGAERGVAGRK